METSTSTPGWRIYNIPLQVVKNTSIPFSSLISQTLQFIVNDCGWMDYMHYIFVLKMKLCWHLLYCPAVPTFLLSTCSSITLKWTLTCESFYIHVSLWSDGEYIHPTLSLLLWIVQRSSSISITDSPVHYPRGKGHSLGFLGSALSPKLFWWGRICISFTVLFNLTQTRTYVWDYAREGSNLRGRHSGERERASLAIFLVILSNVTEGSGSGIVCQVSNR